MGVLLRTFHDVPVKPHIRIICSFLFRILFIDNTLDLGTYRTVATKAQESLCKRQSLRCPLYIKFNLWRLQ